jgi:hypothetical protein
MKEYLKMSDVFALPLQSEMDRGQQTNLIKGKYGIPIGGFLKMELSQHAAHAINSHDELVAEVGRLRSALAERESLDWRDGLHGLDRPTDFAERESAVRCVGRAASIAKAAISNTNTQKS